MPVSLPALNSTSWYPWAQQVDQVTRAVVNVKTYGATGDGTSNDTAAIEAAFATGEAVYFPPGEYVYTGTGIDRANVWCYGEHMDTSRILLGSNSYMVNRTSGLMTALSISNLGFHGGKGAFRSTYTGVNVVETEFVVSDCSFREFTVCAVGHNASDWPNWRIDRCYATTTTTSAICYALSGFADACSITHCGFGGDYRIGIKVGRSALNMLIDNIDLTGGTRGTTHPAGVGIWVVPETAPSNSGVGFVVQNSKLGNEHLRDGVDYRIVYADEDTATGSDFTTHPPALTTASSGYITGHRIMNCGVIGLDDGGGGNPVVFSTTPNVYGCQYGPLMIGGTDPSYVLQFLAAVTSSVPPRRSTMNAVHVLFPGTDARPTFKLSNVAGAVGQVNDSYATKLVHPTRTEVRRDLLRAVPSVTLHPTPPTVTLSAGNATTSISNAVSIGYNDPALRYTACDGVENPFGQTWHVIGVTPVGSAVDRGAPYALDFIADSADFEIGLQGFVANRDYKLYVDGQPLTADVQAGPGATGLRHWLRLTFTSRRPRHIRCVTNAGIANLSIGPNDTLWSTSRPVYGKRAYFLGDSFTQGAAADKQQEAYLYGVCEQLGWEPLNGGEAGTGYVTTAVDSGHPDRAPFPNRINDIPTTTDVVVVYGGTNDLTQSTSAIQTAAALTYANIAARLPGVPVYVFGCQYPSGAADTARDATDSAIAAAAAAAPNVVAFTSVKSWFTGTGRVGSTTGSGNADIYTSADALHPTSAGHAAIASRMYGSIVQTWAPAPTV